MVQITFDTNNDSLEDLEQALSILQNSIQKRSGTKTTQEIHKQEKIYDQENDSVKSEVTPKIETIKDEVEDDTPFIKITINKGENKADDNHQDKESSSKVPTLNQLISEEGISEEELTRMFKGTAVQDEKSSKNDKKETYTEEKTYLEIIDYDDKK